jgi:hypothetical protein
MRPDRAVRDVLPGQPLARHIDDFLTDLANANKPRNTIRAYRGDLTAFAAHHDGDTAALTAAPVRAFLSEIAVQAWPPASANAPRSPRSAGGSCPSRWCAAAWATTFTETTQVYTLLADQVADTEISAARRKRETRLR